jgi:hypothetical protein
MIKLFFSWLLFFQRYYFLTLIFYQIQGIFFAQTIFIILKFKKCFHSDQNIGT